MKIEIKYQCFNAKLVGYNGSHGRDIASASGCWDDESEADTALDNAIDAEAQSYMDGAGYGVWTFSIEELLASPFWRDMGLHEKMEVVGKVRAASEKYGDEIPCSQSNMGFNFGDDAESESDIKDYCITHDYNRVQREYEWIPSYEGRLLHDAREICLSGELPAGDDDTINRGLRRAGFEELNDDDDVIIL